MNSRSIITFLISFSLIQMYLASTCYDSNCAICNPNNIYQCYTCNNGYYNSGGTCLRKSDTCYDSNCVRCTSYSRCTQCMQGYFVNNLDNCEYKCNSSKCRYCAKDQVYGDTCTSCYSSYTYYSGIILMKFFKILNY